ncbi:MAG: iron-sulfur cluster assembly scaffold protein [bacterium]|nr:iron-sulfur cluster assembly scaffold protein [bacterium]
MNSLTDGSRRRATAGDGCCDPSLGRSITDYISRGWRRSRAEPLPIVGPLLPDSAGRTVRYSLRVADGVIREVRFEASSCATLMAYCEVIAERMVGESLQAARHVRPDTVAGLLSGVPPQKLNRTVLATAAFRAAVQQNLKEKVK